MWWWTLLLTTAEAALIAYTTDDTLTGVLGDRAQTSALCLEVGKRRFNCDAATSYVHYFGSGAIQDSFDPDEEVRTATGDLAGTANNLNLVFFPDVWIGNPNDVHATCGEWETESCANGLVHTLDGKLRPKSCATKHKLLCLCSGGFTSETGAPVTLGPSRQPTTRQPTHAPTPYPTKAPTHAPTNVPTTAPTTGPSTSPSASPTKTPTSKSPTLQPTKVPTDAPTPAPTLGQPIYMFRVGSDTQTYQGNFASTLSPTVNGGCGAVVPPSCSPTFRFLRSDSWDQFGATFDLPNRPVYALTWTGATYLLTTDQTTYPWPGTPYLGGLCPSAGTSFWAYSGCSGFTSNNVLVQGGTQFCDLSNTDVDTCNTNNPVLCYCGMQTTFAPTHAPTHQPTTLAPSKSPVQISHMPTLVFEANGGGLGSIGISGFDAYCASSQTAYGLSCAKGSVALMGSPARTSALDFPTLFGFSSTQDVYVRRTSDGTIDLVSSDWPNFITNFGDFGKLPGAYIQSFFHLTGFNASFQYNAAKSCLDWTSSSAALFASSVDYTSNAAWLYGIDLSCTPGGIPMCVCVGYTSATAAPTTVRPTSAPTSAPTRLPTSNAPSSSPTTQPTAAPTGTPIVLFSDSIPRLGALGSRSATTATCASIAAGQSRSCGNLHMLISYAGNAIRDFPTTYMFPDESAVTGPTGVVISPRWSDLHSPTYSLVTAGVLANTAYEWWTGSDVFGNASNNCNGWTSSLDYFTTGNTTDLGEFGNAQSTTGVLNNQFAGGACSVARYVVCACLPAMPTPAPTTLQPTPPTTQSPTSTPTTLTPTTLHPTTPQPTRAPTNPTTLAPTTRTPTLTPTRAPGIVLFRYGTTKGNIGNRATTNATCAAITTSLTCSSKIMLLSYAGDTIANMATTYGFSASKAVYGPTGTQIATSWANFVAGSQTTTVNGAGVGTTATYTWTGNSNGDYTCNEWTFGGSTSAYFGGAGTNAGNIVGTGTSLFCDGTYDALCVCIE